MATRSEHPDRAIPAGSGRSSDRRWLIAGILDLHPVEAGLAGTDRLPQDRTGAGTGHGPTVLAPWTHLPGPRRAGADRSVGSGARPRQPRPAGGQPPETTIDGAAGTAGRTASTLVRVAR